MNAGVSLYEVQSMLGHSTPQMTQRYAHIANSALRNASQRVADVVSAAARVGGRQGGEGASAG